MMFESVGHRFFHQFLVTIRNGKINCVKIKVTIFTNGTKKSCGFVFLPWGNIQYIQFFTNTRRSGGGKMVYVFFGFDLL